MATLTANGVEDALLDICGSKGANSAQFLKELNLALPRLYNMGMWRDLVFEYTVSTTDGTFTLPDHAESIISALVDDNPRRVRAQFHDYSLVGRNSEGNTLSAFGIVDDGYAPTINELPASDDFTGYQIAAYPVFPNVVLPAALAGRTVDVDYEVASGSKTGTLTLDGSAKVSLTDTDTINVTEIRSGTVDLTADVDIVAVPRTYTTDPTLTLSGTTITQAGTVITVPVTDASNVVVGDLINLTGWPVSDGADNQTLNAEYRVTGVDTDNAKIYLYRATDTETWTLVDAAVNKIIHYSVLKLATVREPDYVARFRSFRISNSNSQTVTMRLLLKRKCKKLLDSTSVVYLSSLSAIKHAMLGNTAEDNADLERANYHWGVCRTILEDQLDAHRGAAKPTVKFDPSGVGAYTGNMM
jgi:hypothetical protein